MSLLVGRLMMVVLERERVGKGHGAIMRRSCLLIRRIDGIGCYLFKVEEKSKMFAVILRHYWAMADKNILQATRYSTHQRPLKFITLINLRQIIIMFRFFCLFFAYDSTPASSLM